MPSPFPGMDPYLEEPSLWPDFHATMLVAIRAALHAVLPPRYAPYLDRYVWLEESGGQTQRVIAPDTYVADRNNGAGGGTALATVPATDTLVLPEVEEQGTRYIRIIDRGDRRVVTVVELLSPSNKGGGADREAYLAKRRNYCITRTNLVEIDLLRSGRRPPPEEPEVDRDYRIIVSRASQFPTASVWRLGVRDPLPTIPIPLDPPDADVTLELQRCLTRAYDEAPYATDLDYTQPPAPALANADAEWAQQLLASRTTHQGASS